MNRIQRLGAQVSLSWRLIQADPGSIISLTLLPLILAPFLIPGASAQLKLAGDINANGANQVLPGLAVLGSFLGTQMVIMLFYKEHANGTWQRLRVQPIGTLTLVLGKVIPSFFALLAQLGVVLISGWLIYGFSPNGSIPAFILICILFIMVLVAFSVAVISIFRTVDTALVVASLGGMVLAGLGGALGSLSGLPYWAQTLSHISPAWWALDATARITQNGASFGDITGNALMLLGFCLLFSLVSVAKFRADSEKIGLT